MKKNVFFFLLMVMSGLSVNVQAQDYGSRSINFCTMQMVQDFFGYSGKTQDGRIGAYQFDVNALFDAGACTGPAPQYHTTNWQLCNFRGLTAVDNFIRGPDDLLRSNEAQDRYMSVIRQKLMDRYRDFLSREDVRAQMKYQNGSEVMAAMIYRRGFKATQLFFLTNISAVDRRYNSLRRQWNALLKCAGGNAPRSIRPPEVKKAAPNPNIKVPVDFNWKDFTKDKLPLLQAYANQKPFEAVNGLIAEGKWDGILYDTVDLNGDGKPGLQFMLNNREYCGLDSCLFIVTDNNGEWSKELSAGKIRPAVNGVYVDGVYNSF